MLRVIWDDDYAIPHRDVEVIERKEVLISNGMLLL
jgi:hypothetical protein